VHIDAVDTQNVLCHADRNRRISLMTASPEAMLNTCASTIALSATLRVGTVHIIR
jgi:hypothetical protein